MEEGHSKSSLIWSMKMIKNLKQYKRKVSKYLKDNLVYKVPDWQKNLFNRTRGPYVRDQVEKGENYYGGKFDRFSQEIYHRIYSRQDNPLSDIPVENENWKILHDEIEQHPEWDKIKQSCRSDRELSSIATGQILEGVTQNIPAKLVTQDLEKTKQQIEIYEKLIEDAKKHNLSTATLKKLHNKIKQQETVKQQVEKEETRFKSNIQKTSHRIRKSISYQKIQEAKQNLDRIRNLIGYSNEDRGYQLGTGYIPDDLIELVSKPDLHTFLNKIGKLEESWRTSRGYQKGTGELDDYKLGNELQNVVPTEYFYFDEELESVFFKRFVEQTLLEHEYKAKDKLAKGPFVAAVDVSGSMQSNDRQLWARALVGLLAIKALKENRNLHIIYFNTQIRQARSFVDKDKNPVEVLKQALTPVAATGGTDFEKPLNRMIEIIEKEEPKAEFLMITDGNCPVSSETIKKFKTLQKEKELNGYSVVLDNQTTDLKKISKIFNIDTVGQLMTEVKQNS